jgi:SAM-dependent methyltransferase
MLLKQHKKYYDEIFKLKGVINDPFLMIGYQDIQPGYFNELNPRLKQPQCFRDSFEELLMGSGIKDLTILDGYDDRAPWQPDLSKPISMEPEDRFNVVFDIGCIEHVWNPAQALINYRNMLNPGGIMVIHTSIRGYFEHGYHTFNPNFFIDFFIENNDLVRYIKFSTKAGAELSNRRAVKQYNGDVLLWLVVEKEAESKRKKIKFPVQSKFLK